MLSTNSNCIKSKSHDNIYTKNNYNITDKAGIVELSSNNSKCFIDNYKINKVDKKIFQIENILPIKSNYIKSKGYSDNFDKINCNIGDEVSNEELRLKNLKDFEQLHNINYIKKYLIIYILYL